MVRCPHSADDGAMDAPPIDPPSPGAEGPGPGSGPGASGPSSTGPAPRRLWRRADERLLGGVAGGVADFTGVDVVLVRLGFLLAGVGGGAAGLLPGGFRGCSGGHRLRAGVGRPPAGAPRGAGGDEPRRSEAAPRL